MNVAASVDQGTAYGRPQQQSNALLTQVGPGTPLGELMRRYWHPVALSSEATTTPKQVRILGEDLILFRDRQGRPGLLYPRCMHRGTTLYYGKVEDQGIRCCYHGWLFDVQGHCLDQPCEPNQGEGHREKIRQPWYPVEERYGLIFAYMGPADKKPVLPRWDVIEDLGDDEEYKVGYFNHIGDPVLPYSWLQQCDNIMDPFHVQVLHSTFTTAQFNPQYALMPKVDFETVDNGVLYRAIRHLPDGRLYDRVSHWIAPNIMSIPQIEMDEGPSQAVSWMVPVDDSHYMQPSSRRVPKGHSAPQQFELIDGRRLSERTAAERRDAPGDYEAQSGQGPISLHSEEHLATSDRGIAMQRRMLERLIRAVADGKDPVGTAFDPAEATVHVRSGNFYAVAGGKAKTPQPA